jgi:hypothetical protein
MMAVPSAGRQPDDILVNDGLFPVQVDSLRIYVYVRDGLPSVQVDSLRIYLCMMTYLQCR